MVFTKFWSVNKFWAGLLKYPGSIFIWRRTVFSFSFSQGFFFFKIWRSFHCFVENELVHSDFGTPNRIFASKNFKKPANVRVGNHKSERQNSRPFCFLPKKYQSERGRMDRYTFWKCWRQIFSKMEITTKIRRKWTLYFWIGTPWFLVQEIQYKNAHFFQVNTKTTQSSKII